MHLKILILLIFGCCDYVILCQNTQFNLEAGPEMAARIISKQTAAPTADKQISGYFAAATVKLNVVICPKTQIGFSGSAGLLCTKFQLQNNSNLYYHQQYNCKTIGLFYGRKLSRNLWLNTGFSRYFLHKTLDQNPLNHFEPYNFHLENQTHFNANFKYSKPFGSSHNAISVLFGPSILTGLDHQMVSFKTLHTANIYAQINLFYLRSF